MCRVHTYKREVEPLGCLRYFSLLDTGCTNTHALRFAVHLCTDMLKIRQPASPRFIVRVTDVIPVNGSFSANSTNF